MPSQRKQSHMYHVPGVNDLTYRRFMTTAFVQDGVRWEHSQFCECHLERKLREQAHNA